MLIRIEFEYDPLHLFPYFAKVNDKYFSGDSFEAAKERALKYFKAINVAIEIPPPEEIEL